MKRCLYSILIWQLCFSQNLMAAKLVSFCYMPEPQNTSDPVRVQGQKVNEKMPIASVSKLFTSLFVLTRFTLDTKFSTMVYATPVTADTPAPSGINSDSVSLAKGKQRSAISQKQTAVKAIPIPNAKNKKPITYYDVHIKGSNDPYFNQYKMHMIISKLNEAGVTHIRYLTFDENVKYLHDTDVYQGFRIDRKNFVFPLKLKADLHYPPPSLVQVQFTQKQVILKNYKTSFELAAKAGIGLFKNPEFNVLNSRYVPSYQFKLNPSAIKLFVSSQDVETILKGMNWNSNNFVANRLFLISGGESAFHKLFYEDLQISPDQLQFVNGSGQNHALLNEGRIYNEASCEVVLKTVRGLRHMVTRQQKKLTDVMSVVGEDAGSTVGGSVYSNAQTFNAVVAKTGTIGTNVTLAGMINSEKRPVYFMYNVEVRSPGPRVKNKEGFMKQEEARARKIISVELMKLIKSSLVAKTVKFDYKSQNPLKESVDNYDEDREDVTAVGQLDTTTTSDSEAQEPAMTTSHSAGPVITGSEQTTN